MLDSKVWDVWSEKVGLFCTKKRSSSCTVQYHFFWLHLESFKLNNYGGEIDKIESKAKEEGDITSLEPQTSKVVKICPLHPENICINFQLIRL